MCAIYSIRYTVFIRSYRIVPYLTVSYCVVSCRIGSYNDPIYDHDLTLQDELHVRVMCVTVCSVVHREQSTLDA